MQADTPTDQSTELLAIVRRAGLTESQAKGYLALVRLGDLSPTQLATATGETRTNGYAIADKLVALGLASKTGTKKALYRANHPSTVETLAEHRRKALVHNEQIVKQGIGSLIDLYFERSEKPGVTVHQGLDGIKKVYEDTLLANSDIYLLRTTADIPDLGMGYLETYREKRAKAGIHTYAIAPDTPEGRRNSRNGEDTRLLFHRTHIPTTSYTAPVEIDVFGEKVAFLTFGESQMATVIHSPYIADSMRQVFAMIRSGDASV
jgi:sugar-specific transcriptional regulator TrmB